MTSRTFSSCLFILVIFLSILASSSNVIVSAINIDIAWENQAILKTIGFSALVTSSAFNKGNLTFPPGLVTVQNKPDSIAPPEYYQLFSFQCSASTGAAGCDQGEESGYLGRSNSSTSVIEWIDAQTSIEYLLVFWIDVTSLTLSYSTWEGQQFGMPTPVTLNQPEFQFNFTWNSAGPRAVIYQKELVVFLTSADMSLWYITSPLTYPLNFNPLPVPVYTIGPAGSLPVNNTGGDIAVFDSPLSDDLPEYLVIVYGVNGTDSSTQVNVWSTTIATLGAGTFWSTPTLFAASSRNQITSWAVSVVMRNTASGCPLFLIFYPHPTATTQIAIAPLSLIFNAVGPPQILSTVSTNPIESAYSVSAVSFVDNLSKSQLWVFSPIQSSSSDLALTTAQ